MYRTLLPDGERELVHKVEREAEQLLAEEAESETATDDEDKQSSDGGRDGAAEPAMETGAAEPAMETGAAEPAMEAGAADEVGPASPGIADDDDEGPCVVGLGRSVSTTSVAGDAALPTTVRLEELLPGREYVFEVVATNELGPSPMGAPSGI